MALVLSKLYGIQPDLEAKLKTCGIKDTDDLLGYCRSDNAVEELATKVSVDKRLIERLVHRADLARIRGIGEAYTVLLEAAGIRTMKDLAGQCPEDLRTTFTKINDDQKIVGRVPALAMVNGWVNKAQRLPKAAE